MENKTLTEDQIIAARIANYKKGYNNFAPLYDNWLKLINYHISQEMVKCFEEFSIPKDSRILDAGCGTGKTVEPLTKLGYTHFEGFDLSSGMLTEAKKKGFYKMLKQGYLTVPEEMPKEYEEAFDVVVCGGTFLQPNHADAPAYECLTYACKPGGLMLFTTDEYGDSPEELAYKVKRDEMEKEGKWKQLK